MVVSDGLEHIRHQDICNHRDEVARSVCITSAQQKGFNPFSAKRSWHIFKWNLNQFLIYFTTICFRRNTFENDICTILAIWRKSTDQIGKLHAAGSYWYTVVVERGTLSWAATWHRMYYLSHYDIKTTSLYRDNSDVNTVACVLWKGSVSDFGSKTGTRTL